jgi:4-alpha-glucanotransferase
LSQRSPRRPSAGERGLGALRRLAAERGVQLAYDDAAGKRRAASTEALFAVLTALGSPVARPEDAPAALEALAAERAARRAEPVAVAWEGEGAVALTLPPGAARGGGAVEAELEIEGRRPRRWRRALGRLPTGGVTGSGVEGAPLVDLRRLPLPGRLPFGYHRLRLDFGDGEPAEVRVISAPKRAWQAGEGAPRGSGRSDATSAGRSRRIGRGAAGADGASRSLRGGAAAGAASRLADVAAAGRSLRDRLARLGGNEPAAREWGVFLPLYALRREEGDLGVGDLSGLEELGRWVGELGGSTVATLPLLAAFLGDGSLEDRGPFEPSPYAPASRLFWNELWVDPRRLPEFADSAEARRLLDSPGFAAEAARLASGRHVDYRGAYALRRRVLEALAETFFTVAPAARRAELDDLLARRPELADYAAFRAVGEARGESWHAWPEPLRSGEIPDGAVDETARRFHLYAQLAAEGQLAEVGRALAAGDPGRRGGGGGLYLDLPLGVHSDSYDAWRHRELFATAVSAGAPPDAFFTRGQDWGFHPIHPERSREEGHAHWIAVVRHHLAHAGWLRIDHVMQLHRLWWVPRGLEATDGAYVRYPAEEMTAVLTLESHRARARVVGENLGTVPASVNRALERHGIARMFVLPFEIDRGAAAAGLHRPAGADTVASVGTHDMPTFRAWWAAADVADRVDLGLLDEAGAAEEERRRAAEREVWRRGLARSGHLAPPAAGAASAASDTPDTPDTRDASDIRDTRDSPDDAPEVLSAALASLGASDAALVLVNLEDLWGEVEPQNTPGTSSERPNWRRRAALTLAQMRSDRRVTETLARLDRARRRGGASAASESPAEMSVGGPAAPVPPPPTRPVTMLAWDVGTPAQRVAHRRPRPPRRKDPP